MATVFINGVIGGDFWDAEPEDTGTTLADVRRQVNSFGNPRNVTVFINSVGGDVNEGFAIHNYLRSLGIPITTIAEGKVWSIATVVFLAGDKDKRFMRPNADFFVHNPQPAMPISGDADRFEEVAAALRKKEDEIASFYARETGMDKKKIMDMMSNNTQISASEAVEMGFASAIQEEMKAVAYVKLTETKMAEKEDSKTILSQLKELLAGFKNQNDPEPEPEKEPETPEVPQGPTVEDLQKEIETLKSELAAKADLEKQLEALQGEKASLDEKLTKQAETITQIQNKVRELEALPVINKAPETEVHVKPKKDSGHYDAFAGIAAQLKKQLSN